MRRHWIDPSSAKEAAEIGPAGPIQQMRRRRMRYSSPDQNCSIRQIVVMTSLASADPLPMRMCYPGLTGPTRQIAVMTSLASADPLPMRVACPDPAESGQNAVVTRLWAVGPLPMRMMRCPGLAGSS